MTTARSDSAVRCRACGSEMRPEDVVTPPTGTGPVIEMYQCPDDECARRAAVIFEPAGGMNDDDRSFVEREVARRGAFFPSDFGGGGGKFGR